MKFVKLKKCMASVIAAAMCLSALPFQFGFSAGAAGDHNITVTTEGDGTATATPSVQTEGGQVTLTATPGEGSVFDHWKITTPTGSQYSKTASVAFILDTTGSMSDNIKKVKDNLIDLVKNLAAKDMGLNIAIIEYSDARYYDDSTIYHTFSSGGHWTSDVNEAVSVFDKIKTGRGQYETPTDGFTQLLRSDGTFDFPQGSINNYIFLLTDEDFYDFKDTEKNAAKNRYSMKTWIDKLVAANIKVSVVTETSCESDYEDLYTKTGGMYTDIDSDDYNKLMDDFSDFLDQTSVSIDEISYDNPFTFTMPNCDITITAVFKSPTVKVAPKEAYDINVVVEGSGNAFASKSTAYPGESVSITADPASGYVLESIECIEGGAVVNGNRFVMPKSDVTIKVVFKEDISMYVNSARPYSYVFSYDSEMNLIETNSNRSFKYYPEYVLIKINLGEEYAGKTGKICAGRKSSDNEIKTITLDENGCYVFKADIAKNYSFVLD